MRRGLGGLPEKTRIIFVPDILLFDTVGCLSGRVSGMQKVVLLQLPKVSVETMSQTVQHISPIKPVSASSLAFSNNV